MGASESTPAKDGAEPRGSHSHSHSGDGGHDDHHGHSHSHGGSTSSSRIPAAMTAEQLRGSPGIIPSSHASIPAGGAQWQPVAVTHGQPPVGSAAVPIAAGAGPVIHPDPAASSHHHSHTHHHQHHPQAQPTGTTATSSTARQAPHPAPAPAAGQPVVSGAAFAPTKATAPHTLPESGHVQPLKGVEFQPTGPLPTTTPGAPLTTVHTQAATAPPTLHPIDVVSVATVEAAAAAGSRPAESVVNPSLLPPTSTATPSKGAGGAAVVTPSRPAGGAGRALPAGSKDVWEQLLRWATPLLPAGSAAQWDARSICDAVMGVTAAESFKAALQQRQLERKKRRKAQALENAEAAASGKKVPLSSPTAVVAPAIRGQGGAVLSIPYEIASVLLSVDKALSAMRLQWVPSRVSEDTFFVEYFTAVVVALHGQVEETETAEATVKQPTVNPSVLDRVRAIDTASAAQRPTVQ